MAGIQSVEEMERTVGSRPLGVMLKSQPLRGAAAAALRALVMRHPIYSLLLMSAVIASPLARAEPFKGVDGQTVDIAPPKRVVAVNSSLVEILFGLGRGETIVGTDVGGTWPPEQAKIAKVGHPYHPSLEGIISLKPELVLATEENLTPATAGQLRSAGIPVLILESSSRDGLDGLKRRIDIVARLMNVQDAGKRMSQELDKQRAELDKKISALGKKPRILFLYAHGPGEAFVYGKDTGVHVLIELAGGQNAADFTSGTKALTAEGMVLASPDAILMMNRGLEAVGGVEGALKLPGVALTPAGKNKKILAVDDTIRWVGPRFPQFADTIFKALHAKPSR